MKEIDIVQFLYWRSARHWAQFGLRTLLIGVAIASALMSWVGVAMRRMDEHKQNGAKIASLGGSYEASGGTTFLGAMFGSPPATVRVINLSRTRITDDDLEILEYCPELVELRLDHTRIEDNWSIHAKKLVGIQRLTLDHTGVSQVCLWDLGQMQNLEELTIDHTRVRGEDLGVLSKLPSLRCLTIDAKQLDGLGLANIKTLPALQQLVCVARDNGKKRANDPQEDESR